MRLFQIVDRHDAGGVIVGNLDLELILHRHHDLDGVEAGRPEVRAQRCAPDDPVARYADDLRDEGAGGGG